MPTSTVRSCSAAAPKSTPSANAPSDVDEESAEREVARIREDNPAMHPKRTTDPRPPSRPTPIAMDEFTPAPCRSRRNDASDDGSSPQKMLTVEIQRPR